MHVTHLTEFIANLVELTHQIRCRIPIFIAQHTGFLRGGQNADTQWFGQKEVIAHLSLIVSLEVIECNATGDGQTENGFRRIDGMSTGQWDAGIVTGLFSPVDDLRGDFGG